MMRFDAIEQIEKNGLEKLSFDKVEKMTEFNKSFKTSLFPEKGAYGITEIDRGNGLIERRGLNESGFLRREFICNGIPQEIIEKIEANKRQLIKFDDNGQPYVREVSIRGDNPQHIINVAPDATIKRGNITVETDHFGRPILNKITDLELSPERKTLSRKLRDSSYLENDQIGHLIPDSFGGHASKENVVAQSSEVNQSQIKKVENIARELKREGHKVDYEVKTNYDGKDLRPSSFEPKITVDGKEYPLDDSLRKIYNKDVDSVSKLVIDAKEKTNSIRTATAPMREVGRQQGIEAAKITFVMSTVDNAILFIDGEISADEMAYNIGKETGKAGLLGYGTGYISKGVAMAMEGSSVEMIQSLGNSNVPAAMVSFGVASYDTIVDFAKGEIDLSEFAYDMGNNAVGVSGSMLGAQYGAVLGQAVIPIPGAGAVAGSLVGGMVGYAVSSGAYKTALEYGSKGADALGAKAKQIASATIEYAQENVPEKAADIKSAINTFAVQNNLPFTFA